jgi:FKBP-type peptidyl-prolyl cis-trans isomerase
MSQKKTFAVVIAVIVVLGLTFFSQFVQSFMSAIRGESNQTVSSVPADDQKTVITEIVVGTGKEVEYGSTVTLHYVGRLADGKIFDSSREAGRPFVFQAGQSQVIAGFDTGVLGMKVGGKRKITVPPSDGYGDKTVGPIPANSTLTFEVEVLAVE